jgi:hypothetical protein
MDLESEFLIDTSGNQERLRTSLELIEENIDIHCLCFRNKKKEESMRTRFRELGMKLNIYEGVHFGNSRIINNETRNIPQSVQRLWSVTYGHLDMINRFIQSNKPFGIFCEDDIIVNRTLPYHLPYIMDECASMNIDILLLGYMKTFKVEGWMQGHEEIGKVPGRPYTYHNYPDDQWGVHMYMLSRNGAIHILKEYAHSYADDNVNNSEKPFSPDWTITKCPGLKRALISPMFAVEDGGDSYEHYGHDGQYRFHMDTYKFNYVQGLFI